MIVIFSFKELDPFHKFTKSVKSLLASNEKKRKKEFRCCSINRAQFGKE